MSESNPSSSSTKSSTSNNTTSSSSSTSYSRPKPPQPTTPTSSIPGYKPGPILNGPRKAYLASLVIIPVVAYVWLQSRQEKDRQEMKTLEEEGRKSWLAEGVDRAERDKVRKGEKSLGDTNQKDLSVRVGRSGGGV